jgi:hypothetical protein
LAESGNAGEDIVGGLRPHEGLRVGIGLGDVGEDRLLQVARAREGAALELPPVQEREPTLDRIPPVTAAFRRGAEPVF